VSTGSVPNSGSATFHNTGSFYWAAFYSGDSNNKAAVSGCSTEVLVVNQASPSISTLLHANSIAVNTSTFDTASLTGASANAGGSVDYRFYTSQAACTADTAGTGGTDVGSVTVTTGTVPNSPSFTFHSAGTYYWAAFYSGDSNNKAAVSGCEQLAVGVAVPSISTGLSAGSIPIDTSAYDTATLTGASANAGGSVDYRFYPSQAACAADTVGTGGTDVGSVTVTTGTVPNSASYTFHSAGSFNWRAFYSGDSNNAPAMSVCSSEVLVVNQASPSISTGLHASSVVVDSSTFDTASLTSASANAAGSVDYRYYTTQAVCQTDASAFPGTAPSRGTDVGSVSVTARSVPSSASATFHNAGTYYWAAFYSGDGNNKGAVSGCATEALVVGKASPSLGTSLTSNPIAVDGSTTDSATLTGASATAGGSVDYRFYTSQAACAADPSGTGGTDVGSVTVSTGSVPNSPSFTFHSAGTYYWAAFYSGDANNAATASACSTEALIVGAASPSISTVLHASSIALNSSTSDTASLMGASATAGGTVDYRFYNNQAACQADAGAFPGTAPNGGTDVGSVTVSAGSVPNSASATFHSAGTYYWAAFYSGDTNNRAAVSGCSSEALVVNRENTTTSLQSSGNPSVAGATITFTATVNPAPDGGTASFSAGGVTIPGCGAVAVNAATGKATCPATYGATGAHSIVAVYSGDASFSSSRSAPLNETIGLSVAMTGIPSGFTGQARLTLTCAQNSGGCAAIVGITAFVNVHHHRRHIVAGGATVTVPAGQFETILVGLNRVAKTYLKRFHQLLVTVTVTDSGSTAATTTVRLQQPTFNNPGSWQAD
jgi:hypothetical protein